MTSGQIIIDASFSLEEVLAQRQQLPAPQQILDRQRIVTVTYYSFDEKLHQGQLVVDKNLVADIESAFDLISKIKFPVKSVIPTMDRRYMSEEEKKASLNNSSGFSYRTIANTDKLSNHAFGRAIDINPLLNPFIKGDQVIPEGADYNEDEPGTITEESELVTHFKKMGWTWGGDWDDRKDYMHFEKSS